MSPPRWAYLGPQSTNGGAAGWLKATPAWRTDHHAHDGHQPAPQPRSKNGSVVCVARKRWGPERISMQTGVPSSTVHKILVRHGLSRLAWIDRPTGRVIRRYERDRPGELVHVDVKKVGRIPPGGGWRTHGRGKVKKGRKVGYTYLHVAIDDHSRVAYVEAHNDEKAETTVMFWRRAQDFYQSKGMTIDEVLSDNGKNYTSNTFAAVLAEQGIKHRRTKPYRPQTNGKAERFNRTMADEFLYARMFRSENERRRRLDRWIHDYNHHRNHTAVGGPPASRVHNVCGHYI